MGRHSGRENEALLSTMSFVSRVADSWLAPIAVLISGGDNSSPSSAASASGVAAVDVVALVDTVAVGVAWVLCELQPAARMQIPASASALRGCMRPPLDAVPVRAQHAAKP